MTLIDVRPGLIAILRANPNIESIVTSGGIARIFPGVMKQGETRDSIVYNRITEGDVLHMVGPSGLVGARYQFDSWSQSSDRATTLALLVKETFGGYRGQVTLTGAPPADHVDIQLIESINARDDYDGNAQMYSNSRDYFVWYEERNA